MKTLEFYLPFVSFKIHFFKISYVATVFMLLLNAGKKICMKGKFMEGYIEVAGLGLLLSKHLCLFI